MRSKSISPAAAEHMARVKMLGCVVCGAGAPNEAHHVRQGCHFTTVALCADCHRGHNGWHGNKSMFRIHRMDELDALNETLKRLMA